MLGKQVDLALEVASIGCNHQILVRESAHATKSRIATEIDAQVERINESWRASVRLNVLPLIS